MGDVYDKMVKRWPSALVSNADVERFTGGIISGKTLSNRAAKGEPVPERHICGGKAFYVCEEIAEFMRNLAPVDRRYGATFRRDV